MLYLLVCTRYVLTNLFIKKWFKPGAEAFVKLSDLLETKRMKDVSQLSPYGQTSSIEGFHSVINHFCPKMIHFSYKGMKSRTSLAAMHFNENNHREQATNAKGENQYSLQFPKAKSGGYVLRKISKDCTYGKYFDKLI
ncbi:hypothetical protein QZH41_012534 [Actinostola sp. cb2023]|nr:hypothetical protein QZH41_012534 [Actinostola sp. cb2023]